MARKRSEMCSECGAELRVGPARCPLCGSEHGSAAGPSVEAASDPEGYHSRVQELRDQLRKLREEGAEAV
jgi:predicted amidophosphoribosyltransferase